MKSEKNEHVVKSKAYRLTKPKEINEVVLEHSFQAGQVVVEPTLASICHADMRYYTGQRRPEALSRKLPMSLLHEGIGRVVMSRESGINNGQRVVIVPNLPGYLLDGIAPEECCPACRDGIGANYCHRGRFLGSGMDGIAQNRLVLPSPCVIPIPDDVPDEIAVLAELCSVSYHAVDHVRNRIQKPRVAVFGDGPVGYLTAAVLHHIDGLHHDRLQVFGAIQEKLNEFQFANCILVHNYDFASCMPVDVAIECTGGHFSQHAINQAIQILNPGGCLILMGVSEERVPINTRDRLEKGITVIGTSRSSAQDFHFVLEAMRHPSCQATLRRLLPDQLTQINSVEDFVSAMDNAVENHKWKKTLLDFQWKAN